jgi:molybdopterin synthase catalytic subunit
LETASYTGPVLEAAPDAHLDWIVLTDLPLSSDELTKWATTVRSGAVVSFSGVVRDHAEGRNDVYAMTYEAYEGPARDRLNEIAAETRRRWPDIERLAIAHRLGELRLSEASVIVVVSAPHRDVAFDAARFAIDTLKVSVPIWKKEHFSDDSAWALGAHDVRAVRER